MGGIAASAAWARADVRGRWRSLIALGLLAGITGGLVVAALSGASRTDTALDRLRERENGADAIVFASQVGQFHPDWDLLADQPEVERVAPWALSFGTFGEGGPEGAPPGPGLVFASVDGTFLGEVGQPIVTEGRMYDPDAPDEMVIDTATQDVEVGDVIPFTAAGPDQENPEAEATGPQVEFRVVGRVRTLNQFLFVSDGQALVSPGYVGEYGDEILYLENADVRLEDGAAGVPELTRHVDELIAPGTPLLDLHGSARRVTTTTSVERSALLLLGLAMALAGIVLVGQPLARSAGVAVDDLRDLSAMGMTRGGITMASVLAHLPTVAAAVAAATVTAIIASIWFPVGLAGQIDPDRGVRITWPILLGGLAVLGGLLVGGVVVVVFTAIRRERSTRVRRPGLVTRVRRVTPVSVGLGTTMALEPGMGRDRVPVRPALVGAMVGVLGVVSAMTINLALDDTLDHPERAGVAWDAAIVPLPEDYEPTSVAPDLVEQAASTEGVGEVAVVDRAVIDVGGVGTPTYALRPPPGEAESAIDLVVTDGRAPTEPAEAAIGPETAAQIDAGIGDRVTVGEEGQEVTIVGEALFPSDVHARFDEGLWVEPEDLDRVLPPVENVEEADIGRIVAVRFDEGVDPEAGVAALDETVGERAESVDTFEPPLELVNLDNVRRLPTVLAVFLAFLAVAALGHVLATSARRRGRDFAVLRTLGVTRGGVRLVLNSQGTAIGFVGLLLGIPLGIVVGRAVWGLVAESVPLDEVPPGMSTAVLVLIPVAVLVANALAVWPGQRASRHHVTEALRTE